MNLAELELVTGWFSKYTCIEDSMKSIREKFSIANMVVTMGGDGAVLFMNGNVIKHRGFNVEVVDTVGSGDAFLAGLLSQLVDNAGSEAVLEFAGGLGAFIATQRGGCPEYNIEEIEDLIQNNSSKV
jgi:fructokinase